MPRKILFSILFAATFIAAKERKEYKLNDHDLVGIWQDAPVIASGWGDNFQIFSDHKMIVNFNQMECDRRERKLVGTWEIKDNKLVAKYHQQTILKGGRVVEASGSCASETEIVGGKVVTEKLSKQKLVEYEFSAPAVDPEFKKKKMLINGRPYWLMRTDPNDYK